MVRTKQAASRLKTTVRHKPRTRVRSRKAPLRPGEKAVRDIRTYQRSTNLLIPRMAFQRLVREVTMEFAHGLRFQVSAMEALQEAAEAYLVELFGKTDQCARHARRITIMDKDMRLVLNILDRGLCSTSSSSESSADTMRRSKSHD